VILDGDNIRHGLNSDLGFSPADRTENIRRISEVARLLTSFGFINIVAFISPYVADRAKARSIQAPGDFIEVYVDASVEVAESRDPKGLYRKARAGEIREFTGVSAPYEAPESPEIHLMTGDMNPHECAATILGFLEERGYLPAGR
jgi:adenylyl-sulfate kinase